MKIHEINDLIWTFSDRNPTVYVGDTHSSVDPTPCYGHDIGILKTYIEVAHDAFPLDPAYAPDYWVLKYESIERVNGWTTRKWDWNWEKPEGEDHYLHRPWKANIVLSGKRTSIHPAMTRYLALHEYGHVIHYWLGTKRGIHTEGLDQNDEIYKEYAKIRGIEINPDYGPGKWATNIGEIFANDFRILLGKTEKEFWPHDVSRPETIPDLKKWWLQMRRTYGYKGI